jgi:hypothetical protein
MDESMEYRKVIEEEFENRLRKIKKEVEKDLHDISREKSTLSN